jgi:hypothetical protein
MNISGLVRALTIVVIAALMLFDYTFHAGSQARTHMRRRYVTPAYGRRSGIAIWLGLRVSSLAAPPRTDQVTHRIRRSSAPPSVLGDP